ncbi:MULTISPECIES: hypothetical protein [Hymenobacter]|nr:hypothetical protein [Hymenobacter sp. BT559]
MSNTVLGAINGQQALDLLHIHCEQPTSPSSPALILLDLRLVRAR